MQVKERKFCRNDASTMDNDPGLGTSYTMNIDTASSPGTIDNPRGAVSLALPEGRDDSSLKDFFKTGPMVVLTIYCSCLFLQIRLRTLSGTPVGTFVGKVCYP